MDTVSAIFQIVIEKGSSTGVGHTPPHLLASEFGQSLVSAFIVSHSLEYFISLQNTVLFVGIPP